jgi:hypothetical protein
MSTLFYRRGTPEDSDRLQLASENRVAARLAAGASVLRRPAQLLNQKVPLHHRESLRLDHQLQDPLVIPYVLSFGTELAHQRAMGSDLFVQLKDVLFRRVKQASSVHAPPPLRVAHKVAGAARLRKWVRSIDARCTRIAASPFRSRRATTIEGATLLVGH